MREAEELNQPFEWLKLKGDKPWMNREIKRLIRQRQRLHKQGKMDQWKMVAQLIKRLIDKRKKKYYRRKFTIGKPDYWKEVRALSAPPNDGSFNAETAKNLNALAPKGGLGPLRSLARK